jgi:uncharacterized membrane protein YGL010W
VFADGGSLLDDLSFSFYFHSQLSNQALHFVSLLLIFTSLCVGLAFAWSPAGVPVLALAVFVPYASLLIYLEFVAGTAFALWFAASLSVAHFALPLGPDAWGVAVGLIITMPPLQLLGHVVVERRLPAFRAFEALVTTPLFLMLLFLNAFGLYDRAVVREIRARSVRWRTWRQRTFGKGGVVPRSE